MNYISSVLIAFCVSAVFIGSLFMLCPDGTMSKTVRYMLGICFILSVITAAGFTAPKTNIKLDLSDPKTEANEDILLSCAEYTYGYALQAAGIDYEEILIFTDKSDSDSISITKVSVKTACPREKVLEALGQVAENIEVETENE